MATGFFYLRAGPNGPEKPQQPEETFAAYGRKNFVFPFSRFPVFPFSRFPVFPFSRFYFWLLRTQ